jgi:phosphate transport system substrate-binding protein
VKGGDRNEENPERDKTRIAHGRRYKKEENKLKKSLRKWVLPLAVVLVLVPVLASCSSDSQEAKTLTGAGATFPLPLYTSWVYAYGNVTGVEVSYQGIGSGAGISAITAKTVDFAGSDAIMTDEQQAAAEAAGGQILHIPMTSGAVAVIFNVPGLESTDIRLTGDVLADIYAKTITTWNDPRITDLNPALSSTDESITVVHRSDGSGTTFIFTNYLSKVSESWNATYGYATSVAWPGDVGGEKNAGVASVVQATPYSVGYVELAYALQNDLPYMLLQNAYGNWEEPSLEGVTAATEGVPLPDDMKIMITDSSNPNAYPICGFTWVLAYVNQTDQAKGLALVNYLWWCIHDGQADQYSAAIDYARLSNDAVAKAQNEIRSIVYNGVQLLSQ